MHHTENVGKRLMEIKLSEVSEDDLLNILIISRGNVCKMLHVMEVVSLDVGTSNLPATTSTPIAPTMSTVRV